MRRKFTFYACGSDISDLTYEVSSLDAVFVSRQSETPKPKLLDESEVTAGSHVLIAPRALVAGLIPRDPLGQGVWVLNEGQDPVIELNISRIDAEMLHSGRLYFIPQSVNDQQTEFIDKPAQVQVLADGLFAWAKKWARRAGGRSCGPEAARAVREGRLRLAPPT